MRREAVGAAVGFGHDQGDLFAEPGGQAAPGQRLAEVEIPGEGGRRMGHRAHQVRGHAKFFLYSIEKLSGLSGCLCGVNGCDPFHGETPFFMVDESVMPVLDTYQGACHQEILSNWQ